METCGEDGKSIEKVFGQPGDAGGAGGNFKLKFQKKFQKRLKAEEHTRTRLKCMEKIRSGDGRPRPDKETMKKRVITGGQKERNWRERGLGEAEQ